MSAHLRSVSAATDMHTATAHGSCESRRELTTAAPASPDMAAELDAEVASEQRATLLAQCRQLLSTANPAALPHDPHLPSPPATILEAAAPGSQRVPAAAVAIMGRKRPSSEQHHQQLEQSEQHQPQDPAMHEQTQVLERQQQQLSPPQTATPCTADRTRSSKRSRHLLGGCFCGSARAVLPSPELDKQQEVISCGHCGSSECGPMPHALVYPARGVARGLVFTPEGRPSGGLTCSIWHCAAACKAALCMS